MHSLACLYDLIFLVNLLKIEGDVTLLDNPVESGWLVTFANIEQRRKFRPLFMSIKETVMTIVHTQNNFVNISVFSYILYILAMIFVLTKKY